MNSLTIPFSTAMRTRTRTSLDDIIPWDLIGQEEQHQSQTSTLMWQLYTITLADIDISTDGFDTPRHRTHEEETDGTEATDGKMVKMADGSFCRMKVSCEKLSDQVSLFLHQRRPAM